MQMPAICIKQKIKWNEINFEGHYRRRRHSRAEGGGGSNTGQLGEGGSGRITIVTHHQL